MKSITVGILLAVICVLSGFFAGYFHVDKQCSTQDKELHILLNNVAYRYFVMGKHKAWNDLEKCADDLRNEYGMERANLRFMKNQCYIQDQPWWIPMDEFLKEGNP